MPESKYKVPNWVWASIFAPSGGRLPKRPPRVVNSFGFRVVDKRHNGNVHSYRESEFSSGMGTAAYSLEQAKREIQFTASDRFFWYSSREPSSMWSCCRVCGEIAYGRTNRVKHLETTDCRQMIFAAIRRLRSDNKCAICDADVPGQAKMVLGVWLCCQACQEIWMHEESKGRNNLISALLLEGWVPPQEYPKKHLHLLA